MKGKHKKKNLSVFIDGENISYKKANAVIGEAKKQGEIFDARVYGLQKDRSTKGWTDKSKELNVKDIRLCGKPEKDKADNKIKKDARKQILNYKNVDIICIATSDGGYAEMIEEMRKKGKRVVVIGEEKAPDKLKKSCSKFIQI